MKTSIFPLYHKHLPLRTQRTDKHPMFIGINITFTEFSIANPGVSLFMLVYSHSLIYRPRTSQSLLTKFRGMNNGQMAINENIAYLISLRGSPMKLVPKHKRNDD